MPDKVFGRSPAIGWRIEVDIEVDDPDETAAQALVGKRDGLMEGEPIPKRLTPVFLVATNVIGEQGISSPEVPYALDFRMTEIFPEACQEFLCPGRTAVLVVVNNQMNAHAGTSAGRGQAV